jgi:RNA polymerase sigma factor (sigma-70 family)
MPLFNLQSSGDHEKAFEEFEAVYRQYHKAVYANICKIVKESTMVDDIFQDVFLTLWEHLTTKPEKQSLAGWLFVVSHNKATYILKQELKRAITLVADYTTFENHLQYNTEDISSTEEQLQIIQQAVQHLSPRRKQVFTLSKFEGKSIEEIAEQMSTTPATVKEYLKQSVRMVRKHINSERGFAEGATLVLWMVSAGN